MRQAGHIVGAVLGLLCESVKAGMTTRDLDTIAEREIRRLGGEPSFKGYHGFPASLCVSVNDEIVHGIPGKRALCEGDIVSLDLGAVYQGFQGDAAVTVGVGRISPEAKTLIETTRNALSDGIAAARAGGRLGDISAAVQRHAEAHGYSVVREYTGHGIGRELHEQPQVPNFGPAGQGPLLKKGMTIAIEPMVNIGDWRTRVGADNWLVTTADGSLSAHFEHTIALGDGAPEILTDDGRLAEKVERTLVVKDDGAEVFTAA